MTTSTKKHAKCRRRPPLTVSTCNRNRFCYRVPGFLYVSMPFCTALSPVGFKLRGGGGGALVRIGGGAGLYPGLLAVDRIGWPTGFGFGAGLARTVPGSRRPS